MTAPKKRISEMSDDEKRIAIAEACGWTNIEDKPHRGGLTGTTPEHIGFHFEMLPDYLNDLNAMHEAEMALPDNDEIGSRHDFLLHLMEVCDTCAIHATAAQRAQAYLLTLGHEN